MSLSVFTGSVHNSNKVENTFFLIQDYELQAFYIENGYDVTEQDCEKYSYIDNLKGIANAETELIKHIKDFYTSCF